MADSLLAGACLRDFKDKVFQVVKSTCSSLENLDFVVDALQLAGVDWILCVRPRLTDSSPAEYRYLPTEILAYIATAMDIAPSTVYGVATFYAQFSLEPKGKHVVRMCDGTAASWTGALWNAQP